VWHVAWDVGGNTVGDLVMRLLDLFCGAGGAAMGYHRAGFEVVGVDIKPQKNYPFEFVQADAMTVPFKVLGRRFDAIHASPPCQGYSRLRHLPWLKDKTWPRLIEPMRERLIASGLPWCIENVEDAPLHGFVLCGTHFGLRTYRHRRFETNWFCLAQPHDGHRVVIGHGRTVNSRRKGTLNAGSSQGSWGNNSMITVAGGQFKKRDGEIALGVDWMLKDELSQAIPPAYTEFIGRQLMEQLCP
jgi:DNA (cytosine-5)-methyltransferase 1